ncbi:hypothetical protein M405DRAFT_936016 [Rhizopogon salebrosus TDB-379]|nr:hypothetical protein M405DRAFT_936016 [Rhizopogon salebrosus TDB-379]
MIIQLLWLDRYEVHVACQTLAELAVSVSLDPSARALMIALCILYQTTPQCTKSPVYFHASATQPQFLAPLYYDTRFLQEGSRAIKCPSLPLQLAGGKKVQEALTWSGMLEHFLGSESAIRGCRRSRSHCVRSRHPWDSDGNVGVFDCLQSDSPTSGQDGVPPGTRLTRIKAQQLVLKPLAHWWGK